MTGALINTVTVLLGGAAGLTLRRRVPDWLHQHSLRVLGAVTMFMGVMMVAKVQNPLVLITSVALGMGAGTVLGLQRKLDAGVRRILSRFERTSDTGSLVEGFITTSLLFCVGPMTILGSVQDGLTGDWRLIGVKALMDGIAALLFASVLGWGVLCSAGTVLMIQGTITLAANQLSGVLVGPLLADWSATGGMLVLGIGCDLVGFRKWPVADWLPSLVLVVPIWYYFTAG